MLCFVVGARPNFVKAAPVILECRRRALRSKVIHTGQHYDVSMSDAFFRDLSMPEPDLSLGVGSGSHAVQTAQVMTSLEPALLEERPSLLVVFGDVNSTLAAALTAAKLDIPVAHVESGLRSFDRGMPEEINRVVTDHVCDLLFVTEQSGVDNLSREGVVDHVHLVGNTMIDSLHALLPVARGRAQEVWASLGLEPEGFAVLTMHRPSNVDDADRLRALLDALGSLNIPVVFPAHPRTSKQLEGDVPSGIKLIGPMGYTEFLGLMDSAAVIITDSGGIQEETTALGVPCVTVRANTERPVTIDLGTNTLAGTDPERVVACAREGMGSSRSTDSAVPLWDGRASQRIADILEAWS